MRFEVGFPELSHEDQVAAIETLSRALDRFGTLPEQHGVALDAFRELDRLVRDDKSVLAAETLMKLLLSKQARVLTEVETAQSYLSECYDVLVTKLSKKLHDTEVASLCGLLNTFQQAIAANEVPSELVLSGLPQWLPPFFANESDDQESSRPLRLLVERSCWTTLMAVFQAMPQIEYKERVLESLAKSGTARYFHDSAKKVAPLTDFYVERFEKTGSGIQVDILSVVIFTLIQSEPSPYNRTLIADLMSKKMIECVRLEDKDKAKAAFMWIKQVGTDALALLRAPEFPGAEVLLVNLSQALIAHLQDKGAVFTTQVVSVEVLGKIYEKILQDDEAKEKFWMPPPERLDVADGQRTAVPSDAGEVIACPCGAGYEDRPFMLDCDRCHRWFHGSCVGIDENAANLDSLSFYCDDCQVFAQIEEMENRQRMIEEEDGPRTPTRPHASNRDAPSTSESRAQNELRKKRYRLMFDYLQFHFERTRDASFGSARASYDEPEVVSENADEVSRSSLPRLHVRNCLSRYGASRLVRILAHENADEERLASQACRARILRALLGTMSGAGQIALRKAAVESLGGILEVAPNLIELEDIVTSVEYRMQDEATSVRDACLQYIISRLGSNSRDSTAGSRYRQMILEKIEDEGLAVRKRAVELACKQLTLQNDKEAAAVLGKLCLRLMDSREEQTVKDMIKREFLQYFVKVDPKVVAATLSLVQKSEWVTMLLKLPLSSATNGKPGPDEAGTTSNKPSKASKSKRVAVPRSGSGRMDDVLPLYSETMSSVVEGLMQALIAAQSDSDRVRNLQMLRAFCKADPSLLNNYLRNLVTWIAPAPPPHTESAFEVCEIFATCALSEIDTETQAQLEVNLETLVFRGQAKVLPATVRALENLFVATSDGEKPGMMQSLQRIVNRFYDFLVTAGQPNSENMVHIKRAIYVLSLVARYHAFPIGFPADTLSNIAKAVLGYCRRTAPTELRGRALRGLGLILVRLPDERIVQLSLFPSLLDSSSSVRADTLWGFFDMLQGAVEVGNEKNLNLLVGYVSAKLSDIKRLLRDDDRECRLIALRVLEQLMATGQVHSNAILPELVSLERDPGLRGVVHSILQDHFARKKEPIPLYTGIRLSRPRIPVPDTVPIGRSPSIGQSPATTTAGNPEPPSRTEMERYLEEEESADCFADCYRDLMQTAGVPLRARYETLEKLVDAVFKTSEGPVTDAEAEWNTTRYLCKVLALLPYRFLDEVLFVCKRLWKQGKNHISKCRKVLDPALGPVVKRLMKNPPQRDPEDDDREVDEETWHQCVYSVRVALGVRLKQFLQRQYRISNQVLDGFSGHVPTMKDERVLDDKHLPATLHEFVVPGLSWQNGAMTAKRTKAFLAQNVFPHLVRAVKDDDLDPTAPTKSVTNSVEAKRAKVLSARTAQHKKDDEDQDIEDYNPADVISTSGSASKAHKKRTAAVGANEAKSSTKKPRKSLDAKQGDQDANGLPDSVQKHSLKRKLVRQDDDDNASVPSPTTSRTASAKNLRAPIAGMEADEEEV